MKNEYGKGFAHGVALSMLGLLIATNDRIGELLGGAWILGMSLTVVIVVIFGKLFAKSKHSGKL